MVSLDGHGPAVLHLSSRRGRTGLELCLGGELDIATAEHLIGVAGGLADADLQPLCLDLSELEFVDAAGLRAVLVVRRLVDARGGRLVLTGLRPLARRLLEITGLDRVLLVDERSHEGARQA